MSHDKPTLPRTTEPDAEAFRAKLSEALGREMALRLAIRAALVGAREAMDGNLREPMVLIRQPAFARLCEIERESMVHG
jgi:hypothetical protein